MRSTILLERGGRHDDVTISMRYYDSHAVKIIRELPGWARHFDAETKAWRVHPQYAAGVAAALRRIGCAVVDK